MWRSVPWDGRAGNDWRKHVIDIGDIDVFLGLDVGKGEHHATALTPAGKKVLDKRMPNSEPKLREVFAKLATKHGTVLVVVDQPASIGALPLAVARDMGCEVAYLPGLTMRRIADLYPGEAKTDARDAFVIADAARSMPHTLRAIEAADEAIAELEMIVGFDDDLAGEATRVSNRMRGLLTQIHPHLERVLGPRIQHPGILTLLQRFGSPALIRKAGRRRLVNLIRPKAPRMAERLVDDIFAALDEQTAVVPGTDATALIVPSLAGSLTAVLDQRKVLAARIEELLEAHPLSKVPTSMPGIGVRTGARILIDVGDGSRFPSAAHLAAYAGLAPATRSSGSSIRGEQPSRRGNKQLKRAFFLSAFAALNDPASRAYYDKKTAQGKHHTQALLCLARRRADVLFAMLRDGTFYEPRPAEVT
ncbi:IS110 family transposase [Embleya sp. NBC_00888]|uniref:IS110 family transposase n=1 Tax=Embleya sp. NBC_00888 TaxID=2975960 RepID=UPI00386506EB